MQSACPNSLAPWGKPKENSTKAWPVKKAGDITEEDLDRGGRTETVELAEKAEGSNVDIEGKTPEEVEDEMSE